MSTRVKLLVVGLFAFLFGALVAQNLPYAYGQPAEVKGPKWMHGLGLKVRKGTEDNFGATTQKFGIEVFKDENNNNLIYISETGSISVVPVK